jgi:hypothetical protein
MALKEQILAARDRAETIMEIEEWADAAGNPARLLILGTNGTLRSKVRNVLMGGAESVEEATQDAKLISGGLDIFDLAGEIVVQCVHDPETRARVFTMDDIPELMDKSGEILERIVFKVMNLSKISNDSLESAVKD